MVPRLAEPTHPSRQLRLAIRAEVYSARSSLGESPVDVHSARRSLKRARALVRLGRDTWQPRHRQRLARHLRDAGRLASPARDAEACVEAANSLIAIPDLPYLDEAELIRNRLVDLGDRQRAEPASAEGLSRALDHLRAARRVLRRHPPRGRGQDLTVFGPGLLRIHRRGRAALAEALHRPDEADAHHTLRKRAKDLRYALEYLEPIWPAVLGAWASEVHLLTDRLGEGNDLTVLLATFEARPGLLTGVDGPSLVAMIGEVRTARWMAGLELGVKIWAPKSEAFVADVMAWGDAWEG